MTDNKQLANRSIKSVSKITQENVHLLLPNKVAQLANRLLRNGEADDMATALSMVYSSPVYSKLENERTKYWWLGINALYQDMISSSATSNGSSR